MFSSKSYVLYLLLPWAGYFGSRHHGLTKANETQVTSTPAIKTSLTREFCHDGCTTGENGENSCDTYVTRWVDFYLNIGGWIMLSVVLVGITILVVTHVQGRERRKEIKGLPQLMYKEMIRSRGRWV
ncbi:hypothetical protein ACROYT_G000833 [Oculina patagonica]